MPAVARVIAAALGAALAGAVLAACGAAPPQAPKLQRERIAAALTGIATACGESRQQLAFAAASPMHSPRPSVTLEASATRRAQELAEVYVRDPSWVYQAETLRQIVAQAVSYLRECELTNAARHLLRATAPRR